MKVYVDGLPIPNTNEWWCEEGWTVFDLKADVVKIMTSKMSNPDSFYMQYEGNTLQNEQLLSDILSEGDHVTIGIVGL